MIMPDFLNQPYIAEVLRTSAAATDLLSAIGSITSGDWSQETTSGLDDREVVINHSFILSPRAFHRSTRRFTTPDGETITVPRVKSIRRHDHYYYDIFVVRCDRHVIVAMPFHGLAKEVFPQIDRSFAGKRVMYERLDITNMVIQLGASGKRSVPSAEDGDSAIVVTRCHLSYEDSAERQRDIEQVRLTGSNLGATEIYANLISPVLNFKRSRLRVSPALLGFALFSGGVRKSGATTDKHGNFKISISPGLRQLIRMFDLLSEIEAMENVASVTGNIPILYSGSMEPEE